MKIEELKRLAESAKKAHGGLPWQITMARHDGVTHYHVRGHCEPAIAVVPHEYWEDNYEPPVDDYGYIQPDERMDCDPVRVDIARYIAAANPAAVLELIAEVDRQRGYADDLTIALESSEKQLKDSRANDYTAMCYLADCRMAVGDNGKRMLPEFVEYLRQLRQQRDELLAALKDARELVDDWGAYATAYMQEKHDLAGDLDRLDAAISKVEK
jgi:hypothetical protein